MCHACVSSAFGQTARLDTPAAPCALCAMQGEALFGAEMRNFTWHGVPGFRGFNSCSVASLFGRGFSGCRPSADVSFARLPSGFLLFDAVLRPSFPAHSRRLPVTVL